MEEKEYWAEINEIAANARREAKDQGMDLYDYLHETIDGHQFVIYTYKARHVLQYSSHEDAIFEELGDQTVESMSGIYTPAAYFAMLADVGDALPDESDEEEGTTDANI